MQQWKEVSLNQFSSTIRLACYFNMVNPLKYIQNTKPQWKFGTHTATLETFFNTLTFKCSRLEVLFHLLFVSLIDKVWVGQLSQYSDWLQAGQSGDRIPVRARFSALVQTGPGTHPASCTMGTGSFPGLESGRGMTLTPHPLLVPRSKNRVQLYLYSP
jgi:hypothetical protein